MTNAAAVSAFDLPTSCPLNTRTQCTSTGVIYIYICIMKYKNEIPEEKLTVEI